MRTATVRAALVRRRPFAIAVILAAGLTLASGAKGAGTPSLVGSYPTSIRILVETQNGGVPPVGYTAVRTWSFVRHCIAANCTTMLFRPSIIPGSTRVFRYSLHAIAGNSYRGMLNVPDICYSAGSPPIKVLPTGSTVDHVVITIRPTQTRAGKVVAYDGTMVVNSAPSRWGSAEGCVATQYQKASVKSPA